MAVCMLFRFNKCPGNGTCFGNGICTDQSTCSCHSGWTGVDCGVLLCFPAVCMANGGVCNNITGLCSCPPGRTGGNCSALADDAYWEDVPVSVAGMLEWEHQGRASHSMVVHKSAFYVFGGFPLNHARFFDFKHLLRFDPSTGQWLVPKVVGESPQLRYDHSAVVYRVSIFFFLQNLFFCVLNEYGSL